MKKKIGLLLSMIVCILSLAACSNGEKAPLIADPHGQLDYEVSYISALVVISATNPEQLDNYDKMMIDERDAMTQYLKQYGLLVDFDVLVKGMHSYVDSLEDIRDNELAEKVRNNIAPDQLIAAEDIIYDVDDDGVVAEVHFKTLEPQLGGHDGIIELIFDKNLHVTSITVNTVLGFDESMKNAAVNTLIGMGTVFIMLIVIAIIISLLKYVPSMVDGIAALFKKDKEEKNTESVEKAIENIVAREEADDEEDESDDTELVAVIAAAIAASEGAASVDGFVVRSIRRIR